MKALSISLVTGAALCGVMSAPASAMPTSNLAAAASDLSLGQNVRYVCNPVAGGDRITTAVTATGRITDQAAIVDQATTATDQATAMDKLLRL